MDIRNVMMERTVYVLCLLKRVVSRRRAAAATGALVLVGGALTAAAQLDRPAPLKAGTPAHAQDINDRFEAVYEAIDSMSTLVGAAPPQEPTSLPQPTALPSSAIRVETACNTQSGIYSDCTCLLNEVAISGGACTGVACARLPASIVESNNAVAFGASIGTWRVSCQDGATGARILCSNAHAMCLRVPP